MEEVVAKRRRKANIQKAILASVASAGLLSLALVAPSSIRMLKNFGWIPKKRMTEGVQRARNTLIERGYLTYQGQFLRLTSKGEAKLRHLEFLNLKIKKPKSWDKKWRMLVFDIPERRKNDREKVRITLSRIGFARLQDSVWVYPYNCEDLIALLKADFKIGKDLLYIIADSIENDRVLLKNFNLCLRD